MLTGILLLSYANSASAQAPLLTCPDTASETTLIEARSTSTTFVHPISTAIFPRDLWFGSSRYTAMHINANGSISFGAGLTDVTAEVMPGLRIPTIAPFYSDIGFHDRDDAATPSALRVCDDPAGQRIIVTWEHVPDASASPDNNPVLRNTFQLVLHNPGDLSCPDRNRHVALDIEFRYSDLNWYAAVSSGGNDQGGCNVPFDRSQCMPALAGFDLGDRATALRLPGTGSLNVATVLQFTSNIGIPGVHRYRSIDGQIPGCGDGLVTTCEECDDGNHTSGDGCSALCAAEFCGDSLVQRLIGEECDDGNHTSGDGCSNSCLIETCGDGIVQLELGEECDDGNQTSGDGCSETCRNEFCGDGIHQPGIGEQCDDGNDNDNDGCNHLCQIETCGDGTVQPGLGEECDDGNRASDDGCSDTCQTEFCGDGTIQNGLGEQCDDGNQASGDGCSATCRNEFCGDGITQPGLGEQCDDGNGIDGDGCSSACASEFCGDGVVQQTLGEECDDGNNQSGDGCSIECQHEVCGDGVVQAARGEQCDDGNQISGDGCSAECVLETCGDGIVQVALGEECDDGNQASNDGCSSICRVEFCGDGTIQSGSGEDCDDGNNTDGDGCSSACRTEFCGDGFVQENLGEQCDAGIEENSDLNPDACRLDCTHSHCGDGVLDTGESCDDGDANSDFLAESCRTNCALPSCGDGVLDPGESCDHGAANSNQNPNACRVTCVMPFCGDGVADSGEDCDDGRDNSDSLTNACRANCRAAGCGDGVIDGGEECDLGAANDDSTANTCRTSCVLAFCGDGVVDDGEICDNGAANSDIVSGACRTNCAYDAIFAHGSGCAAGSGGVAQTSALLLLWGAALVIRGRRRRRGRPADPATTASVVSGGMIAVLAAILATAAQPVQAQTLNGFRLNRYHTPATVQDGLALELPGTLKHLAWSAHLTLDLARVPLVLTSVTDPSDSANVLDSQFATHLGLALGLGERYQLAVSLPVILAQSGSDNTVAGMTVSHPNATAVGDPALSVSMRLLGHGQRGLQLGLGASVLLPAGSAEDFAGDGEFNFRGTAMASWIYKSLVVAVNAGAGYRPQRVYTATTVGPEMFAGAGLHLDITQRLRAMAEIDSATNLKQAMTAPNTYLEGLFGARYRLKNGLHAGGGVGFGVGQALGTPSFRMLFTLGWTEAEEQIAVATDEDRDGIIDRLDRCPLEAEDEDGFEDGDGCPDLDNDSDTIADDLDACPLKREDLDSFADDDGCPDIDNDGDGLFDQHDRCPLDAEDRDGFADQDGCPDIDNDGDSILDTEDQCPNAAEIINNHDDDDGCPDDFQIIDGVPQIPAPIEFELNSARIRDISIPELERLAKILSAHPDVRLLSIEGHTCNEGSRRYNRRLSERRAMAVLNWLIDNGIDITRLTAKGWGKSRPLVPNRDEESRRHNRRVEFRIIERDQRLIVQP